MPVVLLIVGLFVLAATVYAAMGRGGELSVEHADHAPLDLGPVSATDVVLLRPPSVMWGYDMQTTDQALEHIAESIRERDVRIVALEQLVTDLRRGHYPAAPLAPRAPSASEAPQAAEEPQAKEAPQAAEEPQAAEAPEAAPVPEDQPEQPQQQQPPPERSHG